MNSPPAKPRDGTDGERDAYLREALRHAPDAAFDAPPALTDNILRQARLATAPVATERKPRNAVLQHLGEAWAWLARPPVAAGMASLMVATLVGMMWWGGQIDEAPSERAAPQDDLRRSLPQQQPPPAEPPAGAEKKSEAIVAAASPELKHRAPTSKAVEAEAAKAKLEGEQAAAGNAAAKRDARAREEAAPLAPAQQADARADDSAASALRRLPVPPPPLPASPAAAPPPAPAMAPAPVPARPLNEPSESARRGPAESAAPSRAVQDAAVAKSAAPAAPAAGAMPSALGQASSLEAAAQSPAAALQAAVAAAPQRWTWQRGNDVTQAMNDVMQAWLAELDAATRGRWQVSDGAETSISSLSLRLWQDGRPHTQLRLDPAAVSIDVGPSRGMRAALPGAEAATLRESLERATR